MSEVTDTTALTINDQQVDVTTTIHPTMRTIKYVLSSSKEIDPATVAVALYLMCHDLCDKLGLEFDSLIEGVVDEDDYH